ncbi:MAG: hypothetical protein AABX75_01610 [Nanoarchaeota archaeon]
MKNISSVVHTQIIKLSAHLSLRYAPAWLSYIFVASKIKVLADYAGMCPDQDYQKFGTTFKKRLININRFITSAEFAKHAKLWCGQVISKTDYKLLLRACNKIKNKKLRNAFSKTLKKINLKFKNSDKVILLTNISLLIKLNKKSELNWIIRFMLLHELIHILLSKNKINFQRKNSKYWKYDEGLVTYCDFWLQRKLFLLERKAVKFADKLEKWYYTYAIKFRDLLKNKNPVERKKAILRMYKKLQ